MLILILSILSLPFLLLITVTVMEIPITILSTIYDVVEKYIAKRRFRRNIMKAKDMDGEEKGIYIAATLNKYREEVME